jgi:hypothetical protein
MRMKQEDEILGQSCIRTSMSWERTRWAYAGPATIKMLIDVVRRHVRHLVSRARRRRRDDQEQAVIRCTTYCVVMTWASTGMDMHTLLRSWIFSSGV